ncbi:MAG: HEAT repeat domain-containing protein [Deltaproteobacteria bacterium]
MSFRHRVLDLLRGDDLDHILSELRQLPPQKLLKPLFSGICSPDEKVKWHAGLNDESGGIGWGVPEAMGEVLATHAGLAEEYAHILVAFMREDGFYLEHEPLQRGLMSGLGRLAQARPNLLRQKGAHVYLLPYLHSPDPGVRGLAARVLGLLQAEEAAPGLKTLLADSASVRIYEDRKWKVATVGELARQALVAVAVS